MRVARVMASVVFFLLGIADTAPAIEYPGPAPGAARASLAGERLVMENDALRVTWALADGRLTLAQALDRQSGTTVTGGEDAATVVLAGGRTVTIGALEREGPVRLERIEPDEGVLRAGERAGGWRALATLGTDDGAIRMNWEAVLRDGANYVRQRFRVSAIEDSPAAERLVAIDLVAADAKAAGEVDGSPVTAGNLFFAVEHPMAANRAEGGRVVCALDLPPDGAEPAAASAVVGVAPAGQLRRAYLYYLERERPRPYAAFLHYNSWYDIAWADRKMDEVQCLAVIEALGRELIEQRGVKLDSVVFDDGWDDNATLWGFHAGFPRGFAPLTEAAARHKTAVGVWLSPWGGYGEAKAARLEYGATQGFETNRGGFSLAGPRYFGRFRDACAEMIDKYDVNYFKFDGIAQGLSSTGAGREFAGDVAGLLRLCEELRRLRPDVFLSITTGTWPSPYWLFYGDSVWRNGDDMNFHGPGTRRQQWITYRDMNTFRWIVRRAPVYPLNSLMLQGIVHAQLGRAAEMSTDAKDWADEVRSFFATGTQLQELYITPGKLTPEMWDTLAEGAAWSRRNADALVDVHWLGGDPAKGEVYGMAGWSAERATLLLRNPSETARTFMLDAGEAFELPEGAARSWRLMWPWKEPAGWKEITLTAGVPHEIELAPFEALVLEAQPVEGNGEW